MRRHSKKRRLDKFKEEMRLEAKRWGDGLITFTQERQESQIHKRIIVTVKKPWFFGSSSEELGEKKGLM